MSKFDQFKAKLRPGQTYRRADLVQWSTAVDRHLKEALQAGALTKLKFTKEQLADAAFGWKAAKAVAGFDIGQTIVAQEKAIVAVEGMEGTDACVERAAGLARSQGKEPALVVVKVAKPRQDFRFDLPVVGLDSLIHFKKQGVKALALEAGSTLVFDRERFAQEADAAGIAVAGFAPEGPAL